MQHKLIGFGRRTKKTKNNIDKILRSFTGRPQDVYKTFGALEDVQYRPSGSSD